MGAKGVPLEKRLPSEPRYHRLFSIISLLVLITLLTESQGYLFSIFLLIAIAMFIKESRRLPSATLLGVISSVSSYVLFDVGLRVPLPKGLIYF